MTVAGVTGPDRWLGVPNVGSQAGWRDRADFFATLVGWARSWLAAKGYDALPPIH